MFIIVFLLISFASAQDLPVLAKFESEGMKLKAEILAQDQAIPWGLGFLPDDKLIYTEKGGKIKILDLNTYRIVEVKGSPPSVDVGQGGLLDILVAPDFKTSRTLFFTYAKQIGDGWTTEVARYTLEGNEIKNAKVLFTASPTTENTVHFGSRLALSKDGFLYISVGERGERKLAQDLNAHMGKVIRIKTDGSVPVDNPFFGQKDKKPEIWSYGHRNPQGLYLDPETQEIWEQEHGPKGGDEINLIQKGKNYGWPLTTYGREYYGLPIGSKTKDGIEGPIHHWTPSIAPSGFMIYKGDKLSKWKGNFFSGALVLAHVNRIAMDKKKVIKEERLFKDKNMRVRAIKEGPDGAIYFSTDEGKIIRIVLQ